MKIDVCSTGHPLDPRTWSGTPFNVCSQLLEQGCFGQAIDSSLNNTLQRPIINFLSRLYYGTAINPERGVFSRYARSLALQLKLGISGKRFILHTGTLDLPMLFDFPEQKHFLYCDYSWNIWKKYAAKTGMCPERLKKDGEKLEFKSYNQLDHIFTIGEYVKQDLITHYGLSEEKITVVGTGRGAIKSFDGSKDYTQKKLLFVAKERFEDKGGPILIEAFRAARKIDPELKLVLAGQELYNERYKNIDGIQTYGKLSPKELQSLFDECSLFVMPAINEPWGLVYLEALSCKMPIVGLNRNGFPELSGYGQYGFSIEKPDSNELLNVIVKAFSDLDALKKKGENGQKFCLEGFSWERSVTKMVEIIQDTF